MAAPISIRGVSRASARLGLQQVDLEIARRRVRRPGRASGCGKTTLLRIVRRLVDPIDGEVRIGSERRPRARRKRDRAESRSGRRCCLERAIDDVRFTQKIAGKVGFDPGQGAARVRPRGHENKRARQLSGGMLQRVNIASAMAHDPAVLLMDEPFAALDEMKREEIGEWFDSELALRPKTVLFVTHHIDEAVMLADRLVVFSPAPGRVLEVVSGAGAAAARSVVPPGSRASSPSPAMCAAC
jgi:NitT/TauT family transport system ATP-binding protein